MKRKTYNVIATTKPWDFHYYKKKLGKNWLIVNTNIKLKKVLKKSINKIFFVHWSKIISSDILKNFCCIAFHMTDLPYGRGGSPLQNLILAGKKTTKITAFKMTDKIDAGPIYLKKKLKLEGRAVEIFDNAKIITLKMIKEINTKKITPKKQIPSKIMFKRLTKKDNYLNFNEIKTINKFYDKIRMVDAPTYPNAYFKNGKFTFHFFNVKKNRNIIYCSVKILKA
tara:strand:+ start:298 stop:972 length:675 start_codon:yes stop_codon:yes gene_type:complete